MQDATTTSAFCRIPDTWTDRQRKFLAAYTYALRQLLGDLENFTAGAAWHLGGKQQVDAKLSMTLDDIDVEKLDITQADFDKIKWHIKAHIGNGNYQLVHAVTGMRTDYGHRVIRWKEYDSLGIHQFDLWMFSFVLDFVIRELGIKDEPVKIIATATARKGTENNLTMDEFDEMLDTIEDNMYIITCGYEETTQLGLGETTPTVISRLEQ